MPSIKWLVVFLLLNFLGLALGSSLMDGGPKSQWYLEMSKAPWTPPGWMFGFAWTAIMLGFSYYLARLVRVDRSVKTWCVVGLAFGLNVLWNCVFFRQQWVWMGLLMLILLFVSILFLFFSVKESSLSRIRWVLAPYIGWMMIAISLNGYICFFN